MQAPWLGLTGFFTIAMHAVAADLHRRSGARRLRSAQDDRMSAWTEPAPLDVRDLSRRLPRRAARETLAVDRVSFDIGKGETPLALVGESGSGKSVTALSILQAAALPGARHPSGAIAVQGPRSAETAPRRDMRRVRGDDITIVFQEPMTSLNPLHTIEKQIGEILRAASRPAPARRARSGSSNC